MLKRIKNATSIKKELAAIYELEDRQRIVTMLQSINDSQQIDEEEDTAEKVNDKDVLRELLSPQHQAVEALAAAKAQKLYGGQVIHNALTFNQKCVSADIADHRYLAFIDTFQEDENSVRIIETKATSSRRFHELSYAFEDNNIEIFENIGSNLLVLKEGLAGFENTKGYYLQRQRLLDFYDDAGKYVFDLAYQRYVNEHSEDCSNKPAYYLLALLNHEYVYDGRLNNDGSNYYDPNDIIKFVDLTKITEELQIMIGIMINRINVYLKESTLDIVDLGKHCRHNQAYEACSHFDRCLRDKKVPETDSLFTYVEGSFPFKNPNTGEKFSFWDLINQGKGDMFAIPKDWLRHKQKIQYDAIKNNEVYMNVELIKRGLEKIKYPRYFLDFESFNPPLPQYKGEKPFTQSVFQFSLHIQKDSHPIDVEKNNHYFLANPQQGDQREDLIKQMISLIPNDELGSVIVYNQSFEKTRIKEMAEFYPKYRVQLQGINERIFDLMHIVKGNKTFLKAFGLTDEQAKTLLYYHRDFQRSYSIKKVLPVFVPTLDYNTLNEVHNGIDAQAAYMRLNKLHGREFDELFQNMLNYCKLDTWAMAAILRELTSQVLLRA